MKTTDYTRLTNLINATMYELNEGELTTGQFEEMLDLWDAVRSKMIDSHKRDMKIIRNFVGQKREL